MQRHDHLFDESPEPRKKALDRESSQTQLSDEVNSTAELAGSKPTLLPRSSLSTQRSIRAESTQQRALGSATAAATAADPTKARKPIIGSKQPAYLPQQVVRINGRKVIQPHC